MQYAQLLNEGGEAHIFLNAMSVTGDDFGPGHEARGREVLVAWLADAHGIRATVETIDAPQRSLPGAFRLVVRRTTGDVSVPALRVASIQRGAPPVRELAVRAN